MLKHGSPTQQNGRSTPRLSLSGSAYWIIALPPAFLKCRTLVVLKMADLSVRVRSTVRLPSLRILHLNSVNFFEPLHFAEFLNGCRNLEDFTSENVGCIYDEHSDKFYDEMEDDMEGIQADFKTLPKLVRARIQKPDAIVPLEAVSNVQFLGIDWLLCVHLQSLMPEFNNVTHIEFGYLDLQCASERLKLLKVLEHCPNVQILVVDKKDIRPCADDEVEDWSYPQPIPACISHYTSKHAVLQIMWAQKVSLNFQDILCRPWQSAPKGRSMMKL